METLLEGDRADLLKGGVTDTNSHVHDLFHEDAQGLPLSSQPWWRIKLFVWEPVLFGTWDGVFTTCMINIFGVVLFLRTGFLVGNTGVLLGMFLVSLVVLFALVAVMSGIGVCEHCGVGGGGVYSMISIVLGGRVGGTVGLLYVFGQCVAGAMYITGFSESVAELLGLQSQWAVAACHGSAAGTAGNQPGRCQVDRSPPAAAAGRAGRLHTGLCDRHLHAP
ncbi:Solute carrier family 12 member 8 [Dissostichus eleginoides]|uniref:Solute carrier family 12 member 8 n=1 Tax=Dissostichus eleginoides TaxID=100907 RepID=A0AAD9FLC4_DISEL|nr:Solute carrier family 12 member 8 [Dissostichus eleginoides]